MIRQLFFSFFPHRFNRWLVVGVLLMIVGIILMPFIIGIPIIGVGGFFVAIGTFLTFAERIPGGARIVQSYVVVINKMRAFINGLWHEIRS